MISDKTKILCCIVFTLTVSGCSGSGGDEIGDTPILIDDGTNTDITTTTAEVAVGTETSESFATPVASVSSAQMDKYVENPLVTTIPSELIDGNSNAHSRSYITNPLIN